MISESVFSILRKTSRRPSGDQRGPAWITASLESEVSCRGFRPVPSLIQIRRGPAHAASKASRAPSGDQAGPKALETSGASRPDPRSTLHMSPPSKYQPLRSPGASLPLSAVARTNTSRAPSGDQAGWMSSWGPWVTRRSSPLASVRTKSCRKPSTSAT